MKNKLLYLEGGISILVNCILFILKFIIGTLSGSVAMIADAWHSLSDSFTSMTVIFSAKISSKPGDQEHPFGHGRFDLIATVIIGVLLGITGFNIALESVEGLFIRESIDFHPWAVWVTIASILIKEVLAQYAFYAARKTGQKSLKADGWHHRSDALSSILILTGILIGKYIPWIDGVTGIFLAVIILITAFSLIRDAQNKLLGEEVDPQLKSSIKEIVKQFLGKDKMAHHFHIHRYGDHSELTFHLYIDGHSSVQEAHKIVKDIKSKINKQYAIETTINIEEYVKRRPL